MCSAPGLFAHLLHKRRDGAPGDDHLLVNGDHALDQVNPVKGEAKRLALPQPRPGVQQDKQGVAAGHGTREN
jgi:hypothetical protein